MNASKKRDPRSWEKWERAGALSYPYPSLRAYDGLPIVAIGEHFSGRESGFSTLSLGHRVVHEGPGWKVLEPVGYIVVPSKGYEIGQVIKVPPTAVPVDVFFGERQ